MFKRTLNFYRLLVEKNYSTLAGGIGFFLLINGGSFLFLLLMIANYLNINVEFDQLRYIPDDIESVINYVIYNAKLSVTGNIVLLITSVWGSGNLFYHVLKSGEIIYEQKRTKTKLFTRIIALICMMIFLLIILASIFFIAISQYLFSFIKITIIKRLLIYTMYLMIPFLFLIYINTYVCPFKIKVKDTIYGSIFTSLFWVISTIVFSIFLKVFNFGQIYGALAFALIFFLWIYILTNGLIVGFIINFQKLNRKKKRSLCNNKNE